MSNRSARRGEALNQLTNKLNTAKKIRTDSKGKPGRRKWFLAKRLTPKQESKRASRPGPVPAQQKVMAIAINVKWGMNRGGGLYCRAIMGGPSPVATVAT